MLIPKRLAAAVLAALLTAYASLLCAENYMGLEPGAEGIPMVTGSKIDHNGIVINPVPVNCQRHSETAFTADAAFAVSGRKDAVKEAEALLPTSPKGVKLSIDYGKGAARRAGVKGVKGAYALEIGPKGVKIVGYDPDGAFYGLQTLRQILASDAVKASGNVPCFKINDYPTIARRGLVEGFYGTPWSHQVRLSLIEFLGANKMNYYLYGPKDDPYHRTPSWRIPYPATEAANLRELVEASKRNHVEFVWAIHPGKDIRWNKEDYDSLVAKFNSVYDLGVRSYAIFFDDIEGEGTNTAKQVALLNDVMRDFVDRKGDIGQFIVCPTDYTKAWANPTEEGQLAGYGRDLDPRIDVIWTGDQVCADITASTMDFVNSRIKRPATVWWNFPVSDYCVNIAELGPAYGLDPVLTPENLAGIASNPMEHGEASKIALYGVGDYAWNPAGYNALDNWERAIALLCPSDPEALRTLCIHSCDTGRGYRRAESWETELIDIDNYTPEQYDALYRQFAELASVAPRLEAALAGTQLLVELAPWAEQASVLGRRGLTLLDALRLKQLGADRNTILTLIAPALQPTDDEQASYAAHSVGALKVKPFVDSALQALYDEVNN